MKIYANKVNNYTLFNGANEKQISVGDSIEGAVSSIDSEHITLFYHNEYLTTNKPSGFNHQVGDLIKLGVKNVSANQIELNYSPKLVGSSPVLSHATELSNGMLKKLKSLQQKPNDSKEIELGLDVVKNINNEMEALDTDQMTQLVDQLGDLTKIDMSNLFQNIKAQKMENAIKPMDTDAQVEKYKSLAYSDEMVKSIIQKLEKNNIPVNSGNIAKLRNALNQWDAIPQDSHSFVMQAIQNPEQLTAKGMYQMSQTVEKKPEPSIQSAISENQIKAHLSKINVTESSEHLTLAKSMIEKGIPIEKETMDFADQVTANIQSVTKENILDSAAFQLSLSESIGSMTLNQMVVGDVKQLLTENTRLANQLLELPMEQSNEMLLVEPLKFKQMTINEVLVTMTNRLRETIDQGLNLKKADNNNMLKTEMAEEAHINPFIETNKESIRLLTLQLNQITLTQLSRQNIHIGTETIDKLSKYIQSTKLNLLEHTPKNDVIDEVETIVNKVKQSSGYPIAEVLFRSIPFTLREIATASDKLPMQAIIAYEKNGTLIRKDLGDQVEKAFSQVESLLVQKDIPVNEETIQIGKILTYSKINWEQEQFLELSTAKAKVDVILKQITPQLVMEYIRKGKNIVDESIDAIVETIKEQGLDTQELTLNDIAKELLKMTKTDDQDVIQAVKVIYNALSIVKQTQGKALGYLIKNEMPIDLRNLVQAAHLVKKTNKEMPAIDVEINNLTGMLDEQKNQNETVLSRIDKFFMQQATQVETIKATMLQVQINGTEASKMVQSLNLPFTVSQIEQAQKSLGKPLGRAIQEKLNTGKNTVRDISELDMESENELNSYIQSLKADDSSDTSQNDNQQNQNENQEVIDFAKKLSASRGIYKVPYQVNEEIQQLNIYFGGNMLETLEKNGSFDGLFGFDFGSKGKVKVDFTATMNQLTINQFETSTDDLNESKLLKRLFIEQSNEWGFQVVENKIERNKQTQKHFESYFEEMI